MRKKFVYANGYNISQARKFLRFYFGDFFIKADVNSSKLRFDIYLKRTVEETKGELLNINEFADLKYFNEYWNDINPEQPAWNVMVVDNNI